jgi:hypothetical protein
VATGSPRIDLGVLCDERLDTLDRAVGEPRVALDVRERRPVGELSPLRSRRLSRDVQGKVDSPQRVERQRMHTEGVVGFGRNLDRTTARRFGGLEIAHSLLASREHAQTFGERGKTFTASLAASSASSLRSYMRSLSGKWYRA